MPGRSAPPAAGYFCNVFASHLHTDHVGDFMGLHVAGWLSGRYDPIHIYGPTGSSPALGTKAFREGMQKGYAWDLQTRSGALPGKHIVSGKWKGYTPPPMPKKK